MTDRSVARALFARWREETVAALGAAREELDALNVYPVPDKDTGTNVYLTVEAAAASARAADADGAGLHEVGRAFVDGALRGAQGNSGVIVSQLLRASVPRLISALSDADEIDPVAAGAQVAAVLTAAADAAYAAVENPVEGTILSVARAAADGAAGVAGKGAGEGAGLPEVLHAATAAAQVALARTPDQLDVLRRAGVVDAGGQALTVLLDETERILTGRLDRRRGRGRRPLPVPTAPDEDLAPTGPAYEVMYLLDADDAVVPDLRAALAPLGDSLVVVGGDGLWNVHVHVDEPGAAIEAAIRVGRPHRVMVTHLPHGGPGEPVPSGRTVVTTAVGAGLAELFGAAGAVVVDTSDGRRPGSQELVDAVLARAASDAVLVPNDKDLRPAAEVAALRLRERGVRVAVIPTSAQVQGLAAIAVHDPGRGFDDDVVSMTAAAGHARHGAVTVATRQVMTSAGTCRPGDVLGIVDGDVAIVGDDLATVAEAVADRLLGGAGELLTLVSGAGVPEGLVAHLQRVVTESRPGIEVSTHEGGQAGYPLLLAVE